MSRKSTLWSSSVESHANKCPTSNLTKLIESLRDYDQSRGCGAANPSFEFCTRVLIHQRLLCRDPFPQFHRSLSALDLSQHPPITLQMLICDVESVPITDEEGQPSICRWCERIQTAAQESSAICLPTWTSPEWEKIRCNGIQMRNPIKSPVSNKNTYN